MINAINDSDYVVRKVAIFSIIMLFSIILTRLASSIYARHNLAKSSIISLVFSIILNRGLNRE